MTTYVFDVLEVPDLLLQELETYHHGVVSFARRGFAIPLKMAELEAVLMLVNEVFNDTRFSMPARKEALRYLRRALVQSISEKPRSQTHREEDEWYEDEDEDDEEDDDEFDYGEEDDDNEDSASRMTEPDPDYTAGALGGFDKRLTKQNVILKTHDGLLKSYDREIEDLTERVAELEDFCLELREQRAAKGLIPSSSTAGSSPTVNEPGDDSGTVKSHSSADSHINFEHRSPHRGERPLEADFPAKCLTAPLPDPDHESPRASPVGFPTASHTPTPEPPASASAWNAPWWPSDPHRLPSETEIPQDPTSPDGERTSDHEAAASIHSSPTEAPVRRHSWAPWRSSPSASSQSGRSSTGSATSAGKLRDYMARRRARHGGSGSATAPPARLPAGALGERCTSAACRHEPVLAAPRPGRTRVMSWRLRWRREKGDPRWARAESPPGAHSHDPRTRALVARLEALSARYPENRDEPL